MAGAAGLGWGLALAAWALAAAAARLYEAGAGPVRVLEAGSVRAALRGSSSVWLVQFYSSACGHCVAFAPAWRALAADVREKVSKAVYVIFFCSIFILITTSKGEASGKDQEWDSVIQIGVLDCGDEENYEACKEYGIQYYPTFRYFRAFTMQFSTGENQHAGADRELQMVRQTMINFLQNHSQETKPPACPPLEPILSLTGTLFPEDMLDRARMH